MHGWILASAIDLLPLFFLILAFVFSREVWLNEEVIRVKLTCMKVKADRKRWTASWPRNRRALQAGGRVRAILAALMAIVRADLGAGHRA